MIKQIILKDIQIEEFSREFTSPATGKILTVSVKLQKGISVSIITNLNETVLHVKEDGVYYPRQNISSRKDNNNELTGEVQESDYFYFIDNLFIEITSDTDMKGKIALNELIILYDDISL